MSKNNISNLFNELKNDNQVFLNYLKAKFPIFHNSNLFSKDFQYGLKGFLEKKGIYLNESQIIELSKNFSNYYETEGIFLRTSNQAWRLNYPDFITQKPGDPFSF